MFRKILTAIELSRKSDNIIITGLNLAKFCSAHLYVLYVLDYHLPDQQLDEKRQWAEIEFQKTYIPLLDDFKNYQFDCRVGVPAFEIAKFSERIDAGCIILGCHRRKDGSAVTRWLGETTSSLMELVKLPVMVVRCTRN